MRDRIITWTVAAVVAASAAVAVPKLSARATPGPAAQEPAPAAARPGDPTGWLDRRSVGEQRRGLDLGVADARDFGAVGDGASHPLATALAAGDLIPGTRVRCRGAYPVGTELDAVGIQEAVYDGMGQTTTGWGHAPNRRKRPVYTPGGQYRINRTVALVNTVGWNVHGAGRQQTVWQWTGGDADMLFVNASAYGLLSDITFDSQVKTTPASALVCYDKTPDVAGLAPQQTSVRDCSFSSNESTAVGFQLSRSGGQAQGDTIVWNNCGFFGLIEAGLRIGRPDAYATNAISNTVLNGDFQCRKYGAAVYGGQVSFYDTHFEGAARYQLDNGGADVVGIPAGGDLSTMTNCRSENLILSRGVTLAGGGEAAGCVGFFTNCVTVGGGVVQWAANTPYPAGQLVTGVRDGAGKGNADGRLYRVTTAGTTGPTEPVWNKAAVTSGTAAFAHQEFTAVNQFQSLRFCRLSWGRVKCDWRNCVEVVGNAFTRPDWRTPDLSGDATDSARHIEYGNRVTTGTVYSATRPGDRPALRLPGAMDLIWQGGAKGRPYPEVGFRSAGGTLNKIGDVRLAPAR